MEYFSKVVPWRTKVNEIESYLIEISSKVVVYP